MSRPVEFDPGAVPGAAAPTAPGTALAAVEVEPQIDEELLIEEISIDGMCGVY